MQGRQVDQLNDTLDKAQGFVATNHQERFDECEEAVNQVLQDIRRFAQQVKVCGRLLQPAQLLTGYS